VTFSLVGGGNFIFRLRGGRGGVVTSFLTMNAINKPVLWIRIGFNEHPDPAFHLDPDPGKTVLSHKVEF
jgi:hypothetical protein